MAISSTRRAVNRKDRQLLDEHAAPPMSFDEAMRAVEGARSSRRAPGEFALGHLKGAVNISLEAVHKFAGSVVKPDIDIVLMTDPGQELGARTGWRASVSTGSSAAPTPSG